MPVKNIGFSERKIRFLIGFLLIFIGGLLLLSDQVHLAIAFFAVSLIPLTTSFTGTCPVYCAMKHSTNNSQD